MQTIHSLSRHLKGMDSRCKHDTNLYHKHIIQNQHHSSLLNRAKSANFGYVFIYGYRVMRTKRVSPL